MSDPKKVALFVDIENVYLGLRNTYNRELSPELLLEKAKARGELVKAIAYADWKELPEGLADKLKPFGIESVAIERVAHSREPAGKRREVVRDLVPVEMTAGMVKVLKDDPSIDVCVVCSGDRALVSGVRLARESFGKEVVVCAIPGTLAKELEPPVASLLDPIEVPPLEPVDEEGLSKLVPLMEELEKRKRYLNFKYIRESVVRHGELKAKTFDEAERLLSDAIACGLVLKQKVEDKYHPGQLFTAYALNRDSALWKKYGSGLPAPVRTEGEDGPIGFGADGAPLPGSAAAAAAEGAPLVAVAAGSPSSEASREGLEPLAPATPSTFGSLPAIPAFAASASPSAAPAEGGEPRERRSRRGRRGGRGDRPERGDRGERGERGSEAARGERGSEASRGERGGDAPRGERGGEAPRGERPERSDDRPAEPPLPRVGGGDERGERSDRGDRGDRGGRDRGGRQGSRSRGAGRSSGGGQEGRGRPARSSPGGRDSGGRDSGGRDSGGRDGGGRDSGGRDGTREGRDFGARRSAPQTPSRWEQPTRLPRDPNAPALNDDEIDEERILRARGDL